MILIAYDQKLLFAHSMWHEDTFLKRLMINCLGWDRLVELQIYLSYIAGKIESEDEFVFNLAQILEILSTGVRRNFFFRGHNFYVDYETNENHI